MSLEFRALFMLVNWGMYYLRNNSKHNKEKFK